MITQNRLKEFLEYDPETGHFTWKVQKRRANAGSIAGYVSRDLGYRHIGIDGKEYLAHRLVWLYVHGEWPPAYMDHINGIRTDNRLANLRPVTHAQNNINRIGRSNTVSGVKGVCWNKDVNKWMAQIGFNKKHYYLGVYETIEEAKSAYDKAAKELHGEFYRS